MTSDSAGVSSWMSKLYVHPVTGNVGIGTDKPEGILDIKSVITNAAFPPPGMSNVVAVPDYTNMVDSIDVGNMPTLVEYPPPLQVSTHAVTGNSIAVSASTYGTGTYTASASSEYDATNYRAAKAFNKSTLATNGYDGWYSANATRYNGASNTYTGAVTTTASSLILPGEWIQLQMPSATSIAIKTYTLSTHNHNEGITNAPSSFWLVASNNASTWTLIDTQQNIAWTRVMESKTFIISNDTSYSYYRLIVYQLLGKTTFVSLGELQLSADAPYSTIREFPPGPMMDDQVDIGAMYGGGRYVASASSQYDLANYTPSKAFNKTLAGAEVNAWLSVNGFYNASGVYTGTVSTISIANVSYLGDWLQLQLPNPIILQSYQVGIIHLPAYAPKQFTVFGSFDGIVWILIDSQTNQTGWSTNAYRSFTIASPTGFYRFYRFVVASTNNTVTSYATVPEWKLFGSLHQKYPKLTLPLLGSQSTYGTGSYKAYANTLYNPGTPIAGNPTNAIDANAATFWRSGSNLYTSAIDASPIPTVYFEFPDGIKATSYALTARQNAVTAFDEAPGKWNLYGSNMAAVGSWALLDARANISTWAAENPKAFTLTGNTTFYNAYKLEVLRNNSASGNFITIRDVQWIGDKQTPDTKLMITTGGRIGMNALASSEYMLNVDGNIRATGDLIANGYVMGLPKMAIIQDRKPYNVAGGDSVVGINIRQLNIITLDTIGITLNNNKFTIPSGTYSIVASAPGYAVREHQLRLRNITTNTTTVIGASSWSISEYFGGSHSFIDDTFTVENTSSFELQHYCNTAKSSNGLGVQNNGAYFDNVYASIKIVKLR